MRIFDIGANRGHFTDEHLQLYPDAEILCVEANPRLCGVLAQKYGRHRVVRGPRAIQKGDVGDDIRQVIKFGGLAKGPYLCKTKDKKTNNKR